MTEAAPADATTDKTATDSYNALDGKTSGQLAQEALSGLEDYPGDRNAIVTEASATLTRNGELPELMLIPEYSENLNGRAYNAFDPHPYGIFDGNDNIDQAALREAAETGKLNNRQLSVSEQIACRALLDNQAEIGSMVGNRDGIISAAELIDQTPNAPNTMASEMGEDRMGQVYLASMFANDGDEVVGDTKQELGSVDHARYEELFGSDVPTKAQLESFRHDAEAYGALSPSEKVAVDTLINRFSDIDGIISGNKDGKVSADELWSFEGSRGISYKADHEKLNALTDAYNVDNAPSSTPLTPEEVDDLIELLAEESGSGTNFDTLDNVDKEEDGLVHDETLRGMNLPGAEKLAEHIQDYDKDGDGKIGLAELATGSASYKDGKTNEDVISQAQANAAEAEEAEANDTLGDIKDDTAAALATFAGESDVDKDKWKQILLPGSAEDEKNLDVSKQQIKDVISSEEFSKLSPSEQRGVLALYDNFDTYASANGAETTLGPDEFWTAAFDEGIKWRDDKEKILADEEAYDAEHGTKADASVIEELAANGADKKFLMEKFSEHKDMSKEELIDYSKDLEEDDPTRELMEYMARHHDELAKQSGEEDYLELDDVEKFVMEAREKTASDSIFDSDEDKKEDEEENKMVSLTYWRGEENITAFGAIINPEDPEAGVEMLAEMNGMDRETLNWHFWNDKNAGVVIPDYVYEQYYGESPEETTAP